MKNTTPYSVFKLLAASAFLLLTVTACELDVVPDETPTFVKVFEKEGRQYAQDITELRNAESRTYVIAGEGIGDCINGYIAKFDAYGDIIEDDSSYDVDGGHDIFNGISLSDPDEDIIAIGWSVDTDADCNWVPAGNVDARVTLTQIPSTSNINEAVNTQFSNIGLASSWDAAYGLFVSGNTYFITGSWGVEPALLKVAASDLQFSGEPLILFKERGEAKAVFRNKNDASEMAFTGKIIVGQPSVVKSLFGIIDLTADTLKTVDARTEGLLNHAEGVSIVQTDDGGYIVAGNAFDSNVPGNNGFNSPDVVLYLLKYDKDGNFVNQYTSPFTATGADIVKIEGRDEYVITGYIATGGKEELLLLKINQDLNILQQNSFGIDGNNLNRGFSVIVTKDGGIIATGETGVTGDFSSSDVILVKTNLELELIE